MGKGANSNQAIPRAVGANYPRLYQFAVRSCHDFSVCRRLPVVFRHQRSLREVAEELARLGYKNERGMVFNAASIR